MNKLYGIGAVAGTSLFGVLAVLGAMHFRDSAEVPKWTPPAASLAPMMTYVPEPEPPPRAPYHAAAAPKPAPPPPRPVPPPPPAPVVASPLPQPVMELPQPVPPADDDDDSPPALKEQQRRMMEANKLHALDVRNRRMANRRLAGPHVEPVAP